MMPTTPSGWYSRIGFMFDSSSDPETLRGFITRRAFFAAHPRCSSTSVCSMRASTRGLPFSREIRSSSSSRRRARTPAYARSRLPRSSNDNVLHHCDAFRARCTASRTSASPCTGSVATTSPVAGARESNVSPPSVCVRSVVTDMQVSSGSHPKPGMDGSARAREAPEQRGPARQVDVRQEVARALLGGGADLRRQLRVLEQPTYCRAERLEILRVVDEHAATVVLDLVDDPADCA